MSNLFELGTTLNGKTICPKKGIYPAFGGNGIIDFVEEYNYPENTIIIGRVGANCGSVYFSETKCWVTDNALAFITNKKNYPYYIYYLLKHINLNKYHIGSSQPLITQSIINNINIANIPNLENQKAIGNFLRIIDAKIYINNEINSKLESLAKTIYDYWFLQFEFPNEEGKPYKSSGGKMVWNEELKREIPERWEVRELSKIIKENDKSVIQTKQVDNVGVNPFFTSGEAVLLTDSYLVTGFNCYLSTGGNANVKLYDGKASYSTDTWCITSNDNYKYLLGLYLKTIEDYMDVKFFAGTGLKHLQKSLLKKELISIPSENILFAFNQITQEIYRLITKRKLENQQLTSLRDWLLPMLMNGQVTFKEDVHE